MLNTGLNDPLGACFKIKLEPSKVSGNRRPLKPPKYGGVSSSVSLV